jgi:hypothetical protein
MTGPFAITLPPSEGLEYMRILGEWLVGEDGITRPVVRAEVQGAGGTRNLLCF